MDRVLKRMKIGMSVDKVLEIAKTITTLRIRLPNGKPYYRTLYTTPQQLAIKALVESLTRASAHEGDA